MLRRLAHWGLTKMDPEHAHEWARYGMTRRWFAPGRLTGDHLVKRVMGQNVWNPLGLAAGFDKNGELVNVFDRYGFGFMEVGSVTLQGGPGNPKPRLFRVEYPNVMNRMGLNGLPSVEVAQRLNTLVAPHIPFGVNIAKTHSPDIMGDKAILDISECYRLMQGYGFYTVLNISCPNTREGRTFEDIEPLRELLSAIRSRYAPAKIPLLLKLGPTAWCGLSGMPSPKLDQLLRLGEDYNIDGYVCCNTIPHTDPKYGKGGLSGESVRWRAKALLQAIRQRLRHRVLIGCGGVFEGQHVRDYLKCGADLVQAYNGFVRGPNAGPDFAWRVLADAFPNWAGTVASGAPDRVAPSGSTGSEAEP